MNKRIRVALLTNYPADHTTFSSGVETATAALLEGLRAYQRDFEFHVLSASKFLTRDVVEERDGFFFHFLSVPRQIWLRPRLPLWVFKACKELRRIKPDLVHCQDNLALALAAIFSGTTRVFTIHGVKRHEAFKRTGWEFWGTSVDSLIERYVFRHFPAFICISQYAAGVVGDAGLTMAIPNAVGSRYFQSHRSMSVTNPRLLFVGVIAPLKRPGDLLGAHVELRRHFSNLETFFCGDVEDAGYARRMHEMVRTNGVEGVYFPGRVSQDRLEELFRSATALVLPSSQENLPMVIAEAMAAGVPVIATRVGGIPEMVEDGETGLLYDEGNSTELILRIRQLLTQPELRVRLAEKARRYAEVNYSPNRVARATTEAYKQILHHHPIVPGQEHVSEKPTVAHLIRAFPVPGETFITNQIETLRDYHPVVFCHHRVSNPACAFDNVYSIQENLSPLPRLVDECSYRTARLMPATTARYLAERVRKDSTRILHFHYLVDARFFLQLKRLTGLPSVVSVYGYDVSSFPRMGWGYGKRYLQPVFEEMDYFLAMSQDMRRDLIQVGCPEQKIIVHYYGTDTDRFAYPDREYREKRVHNILMCGILEPKKAQDRVLQALRLWEQHHGIDCTFRVTFMGDGPLRPKLERLVREFGWRDRVRILGHVPYSDSRLLEEYRNADIFTLPSITLNGDKEGIPGTIVEAMASGLPVVSTYHAGIPEVITNERDGLLVAEDDLEGLSNALGRLIESSALRERIGRAAAATAALRCRLLSKTAQLESIYDQLLLGEKDRPARDNRRAPTGGLLHVEDPSLTGMEKHVRNLRTMESERRAG